MSNRNTATSGLARLLAKARTDKLDFSLVFTRYALEATPYRLSVSAHADRFPLKGALLFDLCSTLRTARHATPTCWASARPRFHTSRPRSNYAGVRFTLIALLGIYSDQP